MISRLAASVLFLAVPAIAQEVIRPIGDETRLTRVKATPYEFYKREFLSVGAVTVSDYFNFAYDDAERTHYSFRFAEIIGEQEKGKPVRQNGDDCTVLDANSQSQSVLRARSGLVPVENWDEYHRLLDERESIYGELSELLRELASP